MATFFYFKIAYVFSKFKFFIFFHAFYLWIPIAKYRLMQSLVLFCKLVSIMVAKLLLQKQTYFSGRIHKRMNRSNMNM